MINSALEEIIRASIISSLHISILLILRVTIFKKFSRKFNYYVWLIVIIKLLFPFTYFTFTLSRIKNKSNLVGIENLNLTNIETVKYLDNSALVIFLMFILVIYLVYTVNKYIRLKNLINDLSYDIEDEDINSLYKNLLQELHIKKNIKLKYSYEVETPSFFNSCVLLPPYEYTLKELEWIFRHEMMHFKSKDLYIKYIVIFLKIVYWFNPFIYIMDKFIDLDCELYCDERVLKNRTIDDKKDYALTIINAIKKGSNSSNKFVAGLHKESDIRKRVSYMFKDKCKNGILIALILCLLSSITYLRLDSISSDALIYLLPKPNPMDVDREPTYSSTIEVEYETK